MLDLLIFIFKPRRNARSLLVAVSVLTTAVRAFPGDSVAGHPPLVLIHTGLADGESASAIPAEHEGLSAAMALF